MKEIYEMLSKAMAALCDVEGVDLVFLMEGERMDVRIIYHRENAIDMTLGREYSALELDRAWVKPTLEGFVSESVGRVMIAKGVSDGKETI